MERRSGLFPSEGDRRALPVVALGVLVAVVPFVLVSFPGDGGPITFAVRLMQAIAIVVGFGVAATGVHSYRTRDLRPAVATATAVLGLVVVGAVGGLAETSGSPLIPIRVWLVATALVVGVSLVVAYRFAPGADD